MEMALIVVPLVSVRLSYQYQVSPCNSRYNFSLSSISGLVGLMELSGNIEIPIRDLPDMLLLPLVLIATYTYLASI